MDMTISAKVSSFTGEVKVIDSFGKIREFQIGISINPEDILVVTSETAVNIYLENGLIISLRLGESYKASEQDLTKIFSEQQRESGAINTQSRAADNQECYLFSHLSTVTDTTNDSAACALTQTQQLMSLLQFPVLDNVDNSLEKYQVTPFRITNSSRYIVDSSPNFEKLFHCFISFNPLPTAEQLREIGMRGITAENLSRVTQEIHLHKSAIRQLGDLQRLVS